MLSLILWIVVKNFFYAETTNLNESEHGELIMLILMYINHFNCKKKSKKKKEKLMI